MEQRIMYGSGAPSYNSSLKQGDMYYDTLNEIIYYIDSQNKCILSLCESIQYEDVQLTKKESRCEYCGCLYTNDEVMCLHCGAPR